MIVCFQKRRLKRGLLAFAALALCAVLLAAAACTLLPSCKKSSPKTTYELTAAFSEEDRSVSCEMSVNYYNATGETLPCLSFNVYGNAYREGAKYRPVSAQKRVAAYKNGESFGGVEIAACTANGKPAEWVLAGEDQTLLTVQTGTVAPRKKKQVTVRFTLRLANVWHRLGVTDQTVNLGNWFPILAVWEGGRFQERVYEDKGDPFFSETADYTVHFTAPEEYVVAASGRGGATRREGGVCTYEFSLKSARDFALVLSKDFSLIKQQVGGVEVCYYHLSDPSPEKTLAVAAESLQCFSARFGAYPYPRLSVVQTGFIEGGMEYPALVYLSTDVEGKDVPHVVAHEVAHQWWYATVGSDQTARGYLDESLAEYSTVLFFEQNPQYGVDRRDMYNAALTSYKLYFDVYGQLTGKTQAAMLRPLSDFLSEYEYVNLSYNKGILLWETYRVSVGDVRFFRALSHFYKTNRFGVVTEENLFYSLRKSGAGGCGLVQSFLDGSAVI